MQNKKPSKHLTFEQRCEIEALILQKRSIRSIARELEKSPSTILREINNHMFIETPTLNDCANRSYCLKRNICGSLTCKRLCKDCSRCKRHCTEYVQKQCPQREKEYLNLCNACKRSRKSCNYERHTYKASVAQKQYQTTLTESRNGFDLTCEELNKINEIVSPRIKQGQSVYHILETASNELTVSESTIRRLITNCELDARNIDLRTQVKRKQRSSGRRMTSELTAKAKMGHLYKDFQAYIEQNEVNVVEMDCVEGKKEDSCVLLTLHFPLLHMQLAFIMEEHTSACVVSTLDKIEQALGSELFSQIFEVIVTDNGHEFMDIPSMERSCFSGQRTKIFFCEPNRSDQKGSCENNHKLIRYVIPKGTSMDEYTQFDISLMMNHINSYKRKSLYGKTPFEVAKQLLPEDFFILLGLEAIPAENVLLTPSLLKKH